MKIKTTNYTAIFQRESNGGYTAIVPMLPGCISYGKNVEEAKTMIKEAIELYIESLIAHNEEIPQEKEVFYTQISINPLKSGLTYA